MKNYFFSGAGAGSAFSGAGADSAFSGAGADSAFSGAGGASAGVASSFCSGFGGSGDGPQPINEKLAKNASATNNNINLFINFHLLFFLVNTAIIYSFR